LNTGRAHFLVGHRMMPWDHLAGTLIHAEAGGHHAHFDGSPYRPGAIEGGLLCAPDRDSWTAIRREVLGIN
jgi:fructose-1,6-bisphosphatase/inositol monophosphatase family enzyme